MTTADTAADRSLDSPSGAKEAKAPQGPKRPGRPSGGAGGAEQRERLIAAALALFARQGILDTTLAAIAREAGVTPAMVHYYFKTRDQLIDVLIDERFVPLRTALGGSFDLHPDDPLAALTELTRRFVEVGQAHPWFAPLWVREVISEGGLLRQRMHERFGHDNQRKAHAAIERWQREGKLNADLEPSLLFQSLLGLTLLPLATTPLWRNAPVPHRIGAEEIARHAVALITHGIRPA
ncbi:TetR/AcrR family transcriptional regulator [Paraburkholderia tropica]|uniref:TetR family transcriptional regulator n=1 Tax=Paraburkholderia tropica TaxID=92647 RepID=A0A1A5XGE3_9BURK|nr:MULTISPECIES: TetR/AcrR family transcriptional regulator [Paraburkholderia]MBB2982081.1 AcrR family transcriptional regulator [Paraburkholderia tropica]MBB3003043.1 AcrR family transcriptional regulator [Paraburkholderia tropica]MBB6322104.1 AcrR family transcriptional regulator [Paraburkholderia tropica]MDE1138096.1 TetR/AcrR family transcriptional regulator [Paraburkholderia tropica]OBR52240.1 TetR family transcriptional regulator [Paraburkholderia tropica]